MELPSVGFPGGKKLWCCIVDAGPRGKVIGKCTKSECWYGSGSVEYHQRGGFQIQRQLCLVSEPSFLDPFLQPETKVGPHCGCLWFALVDTPFGLIPGKASQDRCWYTFGGLQYVVSTGFKYFQVSTDRLCGPEGCHTWCRECYLHVRSYALLRKPLCRSSAMFMWSNGRHVRPACVDVGPHTIVRELQSLEFWCYVELESDDEVDVCDLPAGFSLEFRSHNTGNRLLPQDPLGLFDDDVVTVIVQEVASHGQILHF